MANLRSKINVNEITDRTETCSSRTRVPIPGGKRTTLPYYNTMGGKKVGRRLGRWPVLPLATHPVRVASPPELS